MGIANDLMRYFSPERIGQSTERNRPTLGTFLSDHPQHLPATYVMSIINRLVIDCHMALVDHQWNFDLNGNCYQSFNYNPELGAYGYYEYETHGFTKVHEDFKGSIIPVITYSVDHNIGTSFALQFGERVVLITAKHCVENVGKVTIYDPNNNPVNPSRVHLPGKQDFPDGTYEYEYLDLAVLEFEPEFFVDRKPFIMSTPEILDPVLVMGYPPTGVFDSASDVNAVLVSETATIAHKYLKAVRGAQVAEGMLPSTKTNYILVSARVKGGNSGGPVINKYGQVTGVITQVPGSGDSSDDEKLDELGFGFAIPTESLTLFLNSIYHGQDDIIVDTRTPISLEDGFSI